MKYSYIIISAVKVNNALTQIHLNGTNFINTRLTQHMFSVWPVAQPIVGEMEMHSVANLATLQQTPLATFFPSKKSATKNLIVVLKIAGIAVKERRKQKRS